MSRLSKITAFLESEGIEFYAAVRAKDVHTLPGKALPDGTSSVVVFLMPYYTGKHKNRNISLYSVSRDYHLYIRELATKFHPDDGELYRFFTDSSPIMERNLALGCGLGFLGDNGLVINEKYGSFVFVGTIVTSAEFDQNEYMTPRGITACSHCGACKKACALLRGESDICYSELNQRKTLSDEELEVVKSRKIRWGCDDCQEVCPHNRNVSATPISFFHEQILTQITPEMVENMSKKDFSERAWSWRGKKTLLRNLTEDK